MHLKMILLQAMTERVLPNCSDSGCGPKTRNILLMLAFTQGLLNVESGSIEMEILDIIDMIASGLLWNSTGDPDAGSELLTALCEEDSEFSLLAEHMLAEGGKRSLKLIFDALESGTISASEAVAVLSVMWPHFETAAVAFGSIGSA
jgi:hypothetical protein